MEPVHVTILVLYLLFMVGIGLWFSRSKVMSTGDDYVFAGRDLPRPVMIGTLLATWVGSGTIIGGASFAYKYGPLASIFFLAGTPVGIVVLYVVAKRVRRHSTYTVPELLEQRYGLAVRVIAAAITLLPIPASPPISSPVAATFSASSRRCPHRAEPSWWPSW